MKKEKTYDWVVRLLKITPHTQAQLCDKLDMSRANLYRYLNLLRHRLIITETLAVNKKFRPYKVKQYSIKEDE